MHTKAKIQVVLADDQRLLREGLRIILEAAPDIMVIGEAEDGESAVTLTSALQPDVLIMDIRMPTQDGIMATAAIRQTLPSQRIILLTTYDTPELLVEGLRAGASGYLLKDCTAEELCGAVRTVARGQVFLQVPSALQLLANLTVTATQPPPSAAERFGLTERELDVLRLIVRGQTNGEIASGLSVSEATVKTHINHIFAKLGARDRTHAVVLVSQFGLFR